MPNMTLSLPNDLHKIMNKHKEIRWSEIARKAIVNHIEKLELMERLSSKSKLTMSDVEEINEKVKKGLYTKLSE